MTEQAITQTPVELLKEAEQFRRRAEQSFGEYALEAGRLLIEAKKKVPHGSWADHLSRYWGGSQRTAEVYMSARKRYNKMTPAERREALQQPFSRSLLVVSQGHVASPPPRRLPEARPEPHANGAGTSERGANGWPTSTADSVSSYLQERGLDTSQLETTQLLNQALDFHGQTTEEAEAEDAREADVEHEPTPLDDILDQPRPPVGVGQASATDEEEERDEMQEEFDRMLDEVARLEGQVRQLTRERDEARAAAQTGSAVEQQPARGWDFVENLSRYLKADESQRTPESLARRAATLENGHGRDVVAYLAMFFQATLNHMSVIS